MTNQHQEWLDFAKSVVLEAGDIMRRYFGKKPDTQLKAGNTIVTVADEGINDLVIKRVTERYPDHDIDGEDNISIFYDQDIRGAIVSNGVVHEELVKAMKELEENVNKQG